MKIRKQKGFTLLELLVVVTILAVISGVVISSLSGQEERAGQGAAANAMAALESGVQVYRVTEERLPGGLESLMCAAQTTDFTAASVGTTGVLTNAAGTGDAGSAAADTVYPFGGLSNVPGIGGGLQASYAENITPTILPNEAVAALIDAGLTSVRFVEINACDDETSSTEIVDNETIGDVPLVDYGTPLLAFDSPVAEGLGFEVPLLATAGTETFPVMVYNEPGDIGGFVDVGAAPARGDVIAVFGIGLSSDLVTGDGAILGKPPFEGNVGRDKYAHYAIALRIGEADLDTDNEVIQPLANFVLADDFEIVAILDADGDYLLEEYAEFAGTQQE